ncbi:MAG: acetyl-CoA carboxylase biotin carboxyl carrier protein [Erysipelotrichaceae bacterium]
MNLKAIKDLMKLLEESKLESISYKDKTIEIEVKKPSVSVKAVEQIIAPSENYETKVDNKEVSEGELIKSPLVGVFYSKSSPECEAFVSVGQSVNKGDVLCIIEAMKVMNEIKAPISGILKVIHVNDGETIAFDQPLFTLG